MKTHLLLRHAKAVGQHSTRDDNNRPLAPRGRADALRVGAYVRHEGLAPDLVLCSAATRAKQTWDLVAEQLPNGIEMAADAGLYLASPARLLAMVQGAPQAVRRLMLVAHNPGMEALARALSGRGSEPRALTALASGYPSSGLAVFDFEGDDWQAVESAGLRLRRFITPKSGLPSAGG